MATTRQVLQILESYQKARTSFSHAVAELSSNPRIDILGSHFGCLIIRQTRSGRNEDNLCIHFFTNGKPSNTTGIQLPMTLNIEILHTAGVIPLLRPLLIDSVPEIQQTSALGLGRIANYSEELAEVVVSHNLLEQLLFSLREQNYYCRRAGATVFRAVSKHTSQLAQFVVDSGALEHLVLCLEEFDPSVKEVSATAISNIARHNGKLAQNVIDAGAVALLVLCAQEPELSVKRAAIGALADISKHAPELAQSVVDAGTVTIIRSFVNHLDVKLKRQVCFCLGQVARHSLELAEVLVAAGVFPTIFICLKDADCQVRKQAAIVIREVAKHTPQLAQFIVSAGGVTILVDNAAESTGDARLPAVMALGYIAAFSGSLSQVIIHSNGVRPLLESLTTEQEDHIKSASAWSLGQIGRHSPSHSLAVAEAGVLPQLVKYLIDSTSSEDLKSKCKKALKAIINSLTHLPALDSLLQCPILPQDILKNVALQLSKILPLDSGLRTKFVTSGGFERLQQWNVVPDRDIRQYVDVINKGYPTEIVQYYSPGYSEVLLQKLVAARTKPNPTPTPTPTPARSPTPTKTPARPPSSTL